MLIRSATPQEWPQVQTLLERVNLPLQGARDHLSQYLVVEKDQQIVATGGLELYPPVALLRSMAVSEDHQRQGLGRQLVQGLIQQARSQGIQDLYLLTTTAEAYFSQLGFQKLARTDLPAALQASEELKGACPQSAAVMHLQLSDQASAADLLRQVTRLHYQLQQQATCSAGAESLTRCHVIGEVGRAGKLTLMDLVARLKLDKAWLSRNVDQLLQEGLVFKSKHDTDGRSSWIELTEAGRKHLDQLNLTLNGQTARIMEHIPADQHPVILQALEQLHLALQAEFQNPNSIQKG